MSDIRENLEEMKEVFGEYSVLKEIRDQITKNECSRRSILQEQEERNLTYVFLSEDLRKMFPKVPAEEIKENQNMIEKLESLKDQVLGVISFMYLPETPSSWDEILDKLEEINIYELPSPPKLKPEPKEKEK